MYPFLKVTVPLPNISQNPNVTIKEGLEASLEDSTASRRQVNPASRVFESTHWQHCMCADVSRVQTVERRPHGNA